ncbi:hypothetical protein SCUCBS95973_001577 [Sporothrix curviconia]|uniref:Major facilitator superfamily (MFS) profile domain-containing protein n=1 Tax=Sporothrix curviconia TaxID=1260050 RepID=A0ABP0AZP0_9PEZI
MLAPFVCMTFVDRVSRTFMFATGFFLCLCTLIVEAALQKNFLGTDNKVGLAGGVAMTYMYVFFYVLFLDGPMFFYIGEIWPSQMRAQGFTIGITAMAFIGGVASLLWFPNTLKKPLEEIAALFGDTADVVVYQNDLDESRFADGTGMKVPVQAEEVENVEK